MPAFSFWVIGPMPELLHFAERTSTLTVTIQNSVKNWGENKKIGISYLHTWINVGLTLLCEFLLLHSYGFTWSFTWNSTHSIIAYVAQTIINFGVYMILICLISLGLIQLFEYCNKFSKIYGYKYPYE